MARPSGIDGEETPAAQEQVAGIQHENTPAWEWIGGEILLALPPTGTLVLALFTTHELTHNPVLFTSLASSAFLIYRDPLHRMNRIRVMATAQGVGAGCGIVSSLLLGNGYGSVAIAVLSAIVLLILLRAVHPPGVSTAMGFALLVPHYGLVIAFAIAVGLVAVLSVLQRAAALTLNWLQRHSRIVRT